MPPTVPKPPRGPVTPEEEAATRARWAALRAERIAQQQAALLSGRFQPGWLGRRFRVGFLRLRAGFQVAHPFEIQQQTNVFLTLVNCDTNIGYDIYYTPAITTNMTWSILATGHIGQTTFTVPRLGWRASSRSGRRRLGRRLHSQLDGCRPALHKHQVLN